MNAPANLAPARGARTPDAEPADTAATEAGDSLITRLGRLWERGRLPSESEVRRLFEARLTDVAANKLARRWCELYGAADGKEAHEVALEGRFGMLVTDQVMPGMDGLSLIRALRATATYASIPILMLSTEHDDHILEQAREAGASGFLAKPFDPEALLASVQALLPPPTVG